MTNKLPAAREAFLPHMASNDTDILIVTDETEKRQRMLCWLTHLGYGDVHAIGSGQEALSYVQRHPAHLLIVTRGVSGATCAQLIEQVRNLPGEEKLPVLVIAESMSHQLLIELLSVGVDDVLLYPPAVDTFEKKVKTLLKRPTQ